MGIKTKLRNLNKNNYPFKPWTNNSLQHQYDKLDDDWKAIIPKELIPDLKGDFTTFVPHPALVFAAFRMCKVSNIKVVIIGQDPYINGVNMDQQGPLVMVPQAMGLSFSVPTGFPLPPSLKNIYKNMDQFQIPQSNNCW